MARADRTTARSQKRAPTYTDFKLTFELDPLLGSLAVDNDEAAVSAEISNLVRTIRGERFYRSNIGSRINALLFEPMNKATETDLRTEIIQTIVTFCPRAQNVQVDVQPNDELNLYICSIAYTLINIQKQFSINLVLQRIR
jgi:phage baseplate assembly protein W